MTRLPASAKASPVAQDREVLPTPPLPVKKACRVFSAGRDMRRLSGSAAAGFRRATGYSGDVDHFLFGGQTELLCKLRPRRIHARYNDLSIDDDQRQAIHTSLHFLDDGRIGGESLWLLAEVMARDLDAVFLDPLQVGGKLGQRRIDINTTNTG